VPTVDVGYIDNDVYIWSPSDVYQAPPTASFSMASNRAYAVPFTVYRGPTRIDTVTLGASTTDPGKFCRVGLYSIGVDGLPLHRIVQSAADLSLAVASPTATMAYVLPRGRYLAVMAGNSSVAVFAACVKTDCDSFGDPATATAPTTFLRFTYSYTASAGLPYDGSDFGAVQSYQNGTPPQIALRVQPLQGS